MTFKEIVTQVMEWLQQDKRVSYRSVKRQFDLDDDHFEDLQEALLYTHAEIVDDDGQGFVWTGESLATLSCSHPETDREKRYLQIF